MTEAEWLACKNPKLMLEYLRGRISTRKLRLFGCACCRRIWRLISDERCRNAVEVAEQLADDGIDADDSEKALLAACDAFQEAEEYDPYAEPIADITSSLLCPEIADELHPKPFDASQVSEVSANLIGCEASYAAGDDPDAVELEKAEAVERAVHCRLLREIVGDPFRSCPIDPAWRAWNDGTVVKLAHGIYDKRAFDRLLILADALEEAGCQDSVILDHCRQPGQHVRGCWVVDLLTGRS